MTEPQEFVEAALAASAADGCVAIVTEHSEANLRWAGNSLTTNGQMQTRTLTVVSFADGSNGTATGSVNRTVATLEEVADIVGAADRDARTAAPADDAAPLVEPYPHDDDWSAEPARTGIGVFEGFAADLAEAFRAWSRADRLLYGFAEHQLSSTYLGTSTGLRRRFDQPDGRLEVNGKSADLTRSAWAGVHSEDFRDVDVEALAAGLEQRLGWAQRRIDLEPGRYETLLPPTAVADLMVYMYWHASARDAEEGRSVFSGRDGTRIGERLATLPLTLRSDPAADGIRCAPFEVVASSSGGTESVFDNGAPVEAVSWIDDGVLTDLARSRAWAGSTGRQPRPFVDNLVLEGRGADTDLDAMIADTERGLLLTCLWYIREVDPQTLLLTGLTRDGVYLVEDGRVSGAVTNFRFNESPVDLLGRATQVGRTEHTLPREWSDYFRRAAMPALRVPDFNMSTTSPAS